MRSARYASAVLVLLLGSLPLFAQKITGDITGTVTDASGALLTDANVTVTNPGVGLQRSVKTNSKGSYHFPELPIGSYRLEVKATGFKTTVRPVEVGGAAVTTADFQLGVGSATEVVNVEGSAPMVEYSDRLNTYLDSKTISEVPLAGRDFQQLMNFNPGVIRTAGGGFQSISINGQREDSNNYFIDGFYNNDRYYGDAAIGQVGIVGIPATIVPPDALEEMTIQENPSAEFGVKSGAPVIMNLKSGTNSFHGSAQWFRHTEVTDAANYFAKHQLGGCTDPDGDCRSPLKNNQYGGLLSGPILKDKLFFLLFYEGQRLSFGSPYQANVPTPAEVAAARARLASEGLTPVQGGESLLSFFPQDPSGTTIVNIPTRAKLDSGGAKIDAKLSANQTLAGRYILADSLQSANAFTGTLSPPSTACCGINPGPDFFNSIAPSRAQIIGLSHSWSLSNNKILESRIGMTRFAQIIDVNNKVNPLDLGIDSGPLDPADYGVPGMYYMSDFGYIGGVAGYPITTRPDQTYDWSEHFSWIKGNHSLKMGGNFQRAYSNDLRNRARMEMDVLASDHVDAIVQLLLGRFDFVARSFGDTHRLISQNSTGFYFQDQWKVKPRFTLSLGLRYDLAGDMKEERNRAVNFLPDQGLVQVGQGINGLYDIDKNNFGPRIGFAWDVTGRGRTALRGGYALTYDLPLMGAIHAPRTGFMGARSGAYTQPNLGIFSKSLSGDAAVLADDPGATCVDPTTGVGTYVCSLPNVPIFGTNVSGNPPFNAFGVVTNLQTAMVHNYHLSLQHEIINNNVLTVSYVGSQGRDQYAYRDLNAPPIGGGARPFATQFPDLEHIIQLTNDSKSWYDSLQMSYRQHGWHGLTTFANFTWSNCRDYNSNARSQRSQFFQAQNPYNPAESKGPCRIDVRRKLTLSEVYSLPRLGMGRLGDGWELITVFNAADGAPFNPNLGITDNSGQEILAIRPNWNGTPVQYNPRDPDHYIANPEVFSEPPAGTIGTAGRDMLRGAGFWQWDFTLSKSTQITERLNATFRWEVYNLLNRANFGLLHDDFTRGTFGTFDSTPDVDAINPLAEGGPRTMQFALKFRF